MYKRSYFGCSSGYTKKLTDFFTALFHRTYRTKSKDDIHTKGFCTWFSTLEDNTELIYFHSSVYTQNNEGGINIYDSRLNIKFPLDIINLSKRDANHQFLTNEFRGIEINEL